MRSFFSILVVSFLVGFNLSFAFDQPPAPSVHLSMRNCPAYICGKWNESSAATCRVYLPADRNHTYLSHDVEITTCNYPDDGRRTTNYGNILYHEKRPILDMGPDAPQAIEIRMNKPALGGWLFGPESGWQGVNFKVSCITWPRNDALDRAIFSDLLHWQNWFNAQRAAPDSNTPAFQKAATESLNYIRHIISKVNLNDVAKYVHDSMDHNYQLARTLDEDLHQFMFSLK